MLRIAVAISLAIAVVLLIEWPEIPPLFESHAQNTSPRFELSRVMHRNTDGNDYQGMLTIDRSQAAVMAAEVGVASAAAGGFEIKTVPHVIERLPYRPPAEIERQWSAALSVPRNRRDEAVQAAVAGQWRAERIKVPNVTDKDTVLALAGMAANAYVPIPYEGDWTNVSHPWDGGADAGTGDGFGWMGDGVRGYVFATPDNKTVVIAYKGTSAAVLDDGGPTAPNDKINDNLLFSCCCARISYLWSTVCDCYMGGGQQCDEVCVEKELWRNDRYYRAALDVYANVTALYPQAEIWVTGHSLGGALSSLVARTYGLPAVTFEAPGEQLAVRRLHLPRPPGVPIWDDHVWHFGHTADPIFTGDCRGASSSCWASGFAMESRCHSGQVCMYDVMADLGWRSSIVSHRIHVVIDDVIKAYNETAPCKVPEPCEDCEDWTMVDPLNPPSTSKSTVKATATRSSTTSTITSTSTRLITTSKRAKSPTPTTTAESTCLSRAWYGRCLEWGEPTATVPEPTETDAALALAAAAAATSPTSPTSPSAAPAAGLHIQA